MNLKKSIKNMGVATGRGLIKGTKIVLKEAEKRAKVIARKNAVLDRMNNKQMIQLARAFGIKPSTFSGQKPTIEDYRTTLVMRLSLEEIIEYARKRGIGVSDILSEIKKEKTEKEIEDYGKQGIDNLTIEVANVIREYKPPRYFHKEFPYQLGLRGFLSRQFPNAKIEKAKGSTRPDIIISGIAIEVKGPTYEKDLKTIADKCVRYREYFKTGLIIVLFNVVANETYYKDWCNGIKRTFPDAVIIRK
jgi:hypothetical protein